MKLLSVAIVATIALLSATSAESGGPPEPRSPIGPPEMDMVPRDTNLENGRNPLLQGGMAVNVPAGSVRVQNGGDQTLFLYYWDGVSSWRSVSVGPGQSADVNCPNCGNTVNIAFHNGKENRIVPVKTGGIYVLSWSSQTRVWDLGPRT
jgi:hypothetical protein